MLFSARKLKSPEAHHVSLDERILVDIRRNNRVWCVRIVLKTAQGMKMVERSL